MVDKINSNGNMVNGFPEAQGPKKGQKKKEVNSNDIAKLIAQVNSQKKPKYGTGYLQELPQAQGPKKGQKKKERNLSDLLHNYQAQKPKKKKGAVGPGM